MTERNGFLMRRRSWLLPLLLRVLLAIANSRIVEPLGIRRVMRLRWYLASALNRATWRWEPAPLGVVVDRKTQMRVAVCAICGVERENLRLAPTTGPVWRALENELTASGRLPFSDVDTLYDADSAFVCAGCIGAAHAARLPRMTPGRDFALDPTHVDSRPQTWENDEAEELY